MHEHVERLNDLVAAQTCGRDLDKLAILKVQSRCLGIEHNNVLVKQTELRYASSLCQSGITRRDVLVAARHDNGGKLR